MHLRLLPSELIGAVIVDRVEHAGGVHQRGTHGTDLVDAGFHHEDLGALVADRSHLTAEHFPAEHPEWAVERPGDVLQ